MHVLAALWAVFTQAECMCITYTLPSRFTWPGAMVFDSCSRACQGSPASVHLAANVAALCVTSRILDC